MRIVILGGAGMLGHKLFQLLSKEFCETYCTVRQDIHRAPLDGIALFHSSKVIPGVDVANEQQVEAFLMDLAPDYIINCVGIVKQNPIANVAIPSITINALLPHKLAVLADRWGGRVIHPSTDCVFDGTRGSYTEDDAPTANNLYGRTKFLGELNYDNTLTLRTSIIGRELLGHRSLVDWLLSQKGPVHGYREVIYSGVTTIEFAKVLCLILRKFPKLHGLYQLASRPISKYELLKKLKAAYGLKVEIFPDDQKKCNMTLDPGKFMDATGYICPLWDEMLNEMAHDPTPYSQWVPHLPAF